ncbi:adenine deaminase [Anaerosinus sp.]
MKKMKRLIAVAKGDEQADLVLKNVRVFNSFTGEFIEGDIAIVDGVIAGVGEYIGRRELNLDGKYVTPGFIDGHVHLESSMLSPIEFARAVVPSGTTTVIADPHEIANVCGLKGIKYILDSTEDLPLSVYVMLPSCVPSSHLENAGATLLADDLAKFIDHPRVLGLGEMMNYPGVLFGDKTVLDKLMIAKDKKVDGHAPGLMGNDIMAYAAAGVKSDHECVNPEEAMDRLRAGMYLMIREGSAAHNLLQLLPVVNRFTSQFCFFATDDRHPADLIGTGHINNMVRLAVEAGYEIPVVLQMATINAATYFGLGDVGAIAPGYKADLLVFDELITWNPSLVFKNGIKVAEHHKALFCGSDFSDEHIKQTVHLTSINREKLKLSAKSDLARVIELVPHQIVTKAREMKVKVENSEFIADVEADILKLVVFERHHATGNVGVGLAHGYGLKRGAIASTIAHDSHNLIVMGTNDSDILLAAKEIEKMQGGIVIVDNGEVLKALPLPLAGLMSNEGVHYVEAQLNAMKILAHDMGVKCEHDPFLTLAFLSLPVIPELKLTDLGLVDGRTFQFVDVAVE